MLRKISPRNRTNRKGQGYPHLQNSLDSFAHTLGNTLLEATTLEVNTIIVSQITAAKFNPQIIYEQLIELDSVYIQENIHESLRTQYHTLYSSLQQEYQILSTDSDSSLYSSTVSNPISLPNLPQTHLVQQLLVQPRFLRVLRKLAEVKAVLDNRNQTLLSTPNPEISPTDIIFVQTVTQLDGDSFHRYAKEILAHPYQDTILRLHKAGVSTSDRQWRGLIRFLVQIAQETLSGFSH